MVCLMVNFTMVVEWDGWVHQKWFNPSKPGLLSRALSGTVFALSITNSTLQY